MDRKFKHSDGNFPRSAMAQREISVDNKRNFFDVKYALRAPVGRSLKNQQVAQSKKRLNLSSSCFHIFKITEWNNFVLCSFKFELNWFSTVKDFLIMQVNKLFPTIAFAEPHCTFKSNWRISLLIASNRNHVSGIVCRTKKVFEVVAINLREKTYYKELQCDGFFITGGTDACLSSNAAEMNYSRQIIKSLKLPIIISSSAGMHLAARLNR